jgi:putative transposase
MERKPYPSDLTDAQWRLVEKRIPPAKPGGHPRTVNMREIVNGILYLVRTGCSWRQLPHDFPPWGTVHYYYRVFRLNGTWERIHDALREQVRKKDGRKAKPSAAILDSQTVKTTEKGGPAATTRARKLRAASGTWSLTRWA